MAQNRGKRLFGTREAFDIRPLGGLTVAPDGATIAYVATVSDLVTNERRDYVNLITIESNESMVLAEGSAPQWSPDGTRIAYLATADGQTGIWIYTLKNKERKFLVPTYHSDSFIDHLAENNFAWSPDGRFVAYVSTAPFSLTENESSEIREINRLLYKTKGGYGRPFFADDRLTHIWVVPAAGGEPELITPGDYNEHSISWAPDGDHIAFISNRTSDPDNNQQNDLWHVSLRTKEVTRLTAGPGTAFQPRWSPDGKYIAYLATTSKISTNDSQADDMQLHLVSPDGKTARCLTRAFDRKIENVQWHPTAPIVYFTAGHHGATNLYRAFPSAEKVELVIGGHHLLSAYALGPDSETIAYVKSEIASPDEIFLKKPDSSALRITCENQTPVDTCLFQQADDFWVKSFDETLVQGWIIPPAHVDPAKRYPLVLVIHGGPHNMFGYGFEPLMQLLPAQGYATLFMNPRGSSGYGQAFTRGNVLNWGGGDYKDLMAGVDYAIEKYRWIDAHNLGVTGQSYGGYMTNWIITQTRRFKAAVVDGGISNLISFGGTSLYHSLMESEFNGNIYDNFPLLWQWSPLRNVKDVVTPTLFVHGTRDNEVPVSQAEEMYVALKKLGVPASFVQYLEEGHGWRPDLKPKNRYDLYNRIIAWFNQYLKKV